MRTDGAAGLLMMSRKRAKEKGLSKCIIPIGYAERTNFKGGENLVDVTKSGHENLRQEGARCCCDRHQGRCLVPSLR